jgi:hypothetical protein
VALLVLLALAVRRVSERQVLVPEGDADPVAGVLGLG